VVGLLFLSMPLADANCAEMDGTGGISSLLLPCPLLSPPSTDAALLLKLALKLRLPVAEGVGEGEDSERSRELLLGVRTSLEKKLGAIRSLS